jgi:glucokinase
MSNTNKVLAFDIGATHTRWAVADREATILKQGSAPTATDREAFLKTLDLVIDKEKPAAIGIGIAGTVSADHADIIVCTNVPALSHLELGTHLREKHGVPVQIDNDGRCALIAEVTRGAASETSSAVMLTLGTGVGGAVMQREKVLPHPQDISYEIGRIVADPTDLFPSLTGTGTIEALIGGRSLEERFGIKMADLAADARKGKADALETWKIISYYFIECIHAIQTTYSPKMIVIGGKGAADLEYYFQDSASCQIVPAKLGEEAGIVGAALLAVDALEESENEASADWDE